MLVLSPDSCCFLRRLRLISKSTWWFILGSRFSSPSPTPKKKELRKAKAAFSATHSKSVEEEHATETRTAEQRVSKERVLGSQQTLAHALVVMEQKNKRRTLLLYRSQYQKVQGTPKIMNETLESQREKSYPRTCGQLFPEGGLKRRYPDFIQRYFSMSTIY